MIQIINRDLFETKITEKDNTNNRFPGGTWQLDVFTKGGKDDKRSAPIVRAYFDTEDEAKDIAASVDTDVAGTKLKSIVKTNSKGKEVIQVKITKCAADKQHVTVLAAIPFRGSVSGVISGENFSLIKGLIKNVDSFKSKATGKTYNKILYLVFNSEEALTADTEVCTVKCDVVSRNDEGLATLKSNQYKVTFNKDLGLELEFVPGTPQTNLTDDELHTLAPKVQFADLMGICFANAERV